MQPRPFWNPYLAGIGLGLTLLLSYLVLGTGMGASGAISRIAAQAAHAVDPQSAESSSYIGGWFEGGSALHYYLVFMFAGLLAGGFLSALHAGRTRLAVERGPGASAGLRLALTILGGLAVGIGSRFAMGCTSGQALSGGALLQGGAFAFTGATFASAFLVAPLVKKEWR